MAKEIKQYYKYLLSHSCRIWNAIL